MGRKCCYCAEPIGDIRCRPLEKILGAMKRPCSFRAHGCREIVSYTEMRGHEAACRFAPHHCPFHGCTFYGLRLYNHMQDGHAADDPDEAAVIVRCYRRSTITLQKRTPFRVLLHRDQASMFLLVNGGDVLSGRSLSLASMGPRPTGNVEVKYKLEVKKRNDPDALVLWTSGAAPFIRRLEDFQPKGFLFVPNSYWDSSDTVSVTVHLTGGW
jgi:E3 ubiquitin-protein ligase SIAH1